MKVRVKFEKYGCMRFIGHLDVMRFFQKLMRRAEIPVAYTAGYSPHMIMSFASPLGIGLTSEGEYMDIELSAPIDGREAVRRMNAQTVEGIRILSFRQIPDTKKSSAMTILSAADYSVTLREGSLPERWEHSFENFMGLPEIRVVKQTKRSETEMDIRPMIYDWRIEKNSVFLKLAAGSTNNLKPDLVMDSFMNYFLESCEDENGTTIAFSFHRLEMYTDSGTEETQKWISLENLGENIMDV